MGMDTPMGQSTVGEMLPLLIIIGVLFLLIIFCIRMFILTSRAKAQGKKKRQELVASGVINMTVGSHMAGLPLAEGTSCNIYEYENKILFKANGSDFTLAKEKITDISIKTDAEITNQYVSSVGGAVAGAVLFGPLGAIVGGRVKKKKSKTVNRYLIFTYMKEVTVDYISFDVTNTFIQAMKICGNFKNKPNGAEVSIEL